MRRYEIEDGTIVDLDNAQQKWKDTITVNGIQIKSSRMGVNENVFETLYKTRLGSYVIHKEGTVGVAIFNEVRKVNEEGATRWLLLHGHQIPEELEQFVQDILD